MSNRIRTAFVVVPSILIVLISHQPWRAPAGKHQFRAAAAPAPYQVIHSVGEWTSQHLSNGGPREDRSQTKGLPANTDHIADHNQSNNNKPTGTSQPSVLSVSREPKLDQTDHHNDVTSQKYQPGRTKRSQELQECELLGSRKPNVFGIRADGAEVADDGSLIMKAHEATSVFLIGRNLYSNLSVALTPVEGAPQDDCTHYDRVKSLSLNYINTNVAELVIELASPGAEIPLYLCLREAIGESVTSVGTGAGWFHQGSDPWLRLYIKQDLLPFYAKVILVASLLSLSGLFSGLNLGLMSLDKNELQVIMKCGDETERRYARAIAPVRQRGNYLLCSILFSNTLVNSTISVLLEEMSGGLVAIMISTILIVLFGEILPQAFCSRYGLAVGARTVFITYTCMYLTFPLSYPVSYCLDWALGEEIGHAYDRDRLVEFIQVTRDINNLENDEVNIIAGALKLKKVRIKEIMTRIEDVFMIDETAELDYDTIQTIMESGYSRIPVHETGNPKNIVAILFAKDLALVDPDDKTPVQSMVSFYTHPCVFIDEDTTLDEALRDFKTGYSHLAIVQRIISDNDRDPYPEIMGIVTLEDVIEEVMQMEINDETDTLTDNRRKRRRKDAQVRKDFSQFTKLGGGDSSFNVVSPQLCLAAYQFLSTTVEPFQPKYISETILKRLLSQRIYYKVKVDDDHSSKRLYTAGEPADYFILILEGRVHVVCGKENLVFDAGPFSFFGKPALIGEPEKENIAQGSISATADNQAVISGPSRPLSRRESIARVLVSPLVQIAGKPTDLDSLSMSNFTQDRLNVDAIASRGSSENLSSGNHFVPDYTVDICANTSYLKVTRKDYQTALKATLVAIYHGDEAFFEATSTRLENERQSNLDELPS